MTQAEILAAARQYATWGTWGEDRLNCTMDICRELIRLHDGGEWSSEPPTEPGDWWFRETMESKPYFCKVYHHKVYGLKCDLAQGYTILLPIGFWLRADPADAVALAELRAEVERWKTLAEEAKAWADKWEWLSDASGKTIDRLQADLAAAKAEVERLRERARPGPNSCYSCWASGPSTELTKVHLVNGSLLLCQICLDSFNRKNPELAAARAELQLWKPLTADEAKAAFDQAEAVPLSDERIAEIVAFATDPANKLPAGDSAQLAAAYKRVKADLQTACKWIYEDHARIFATGECQQDCPRCLVERVKKQAGR